MKVTYTGPSGAMRSKGKTFIQGQEIEVSKEVNDYLKKLFSNVFTFEVVKPKAVPKPKPKAEPKED